MFMGPLQQLMHPRSAALHTLSRSEAPAFFTAPYPVANPTVISDATIQSPNPRPTSGTGPLATSVREWTARELDYLREQGATPRTPGPPKPPVPAPPYIPLWPPTRSAPTAPGPPPQTPSVATPHHGYPVPPAPMPTHHVPVAPPAPMPTHHVPVTPPMAPPPVPGPAYPPVGGPPIQPYAPAPPQHPFAGYPPPQWPQYPPPQWLQYPPYHGAPQGSYDGDSETAKPEKFTGREPSQLRPFIISCVMAFDSRPRKFATERQQVTYAASYLTDIAMLWWQPHLIAQPEPLIHSNWSEFVAELNNLFGQPDIAQASECTLHALKMQDYQHVNKYMIEFSKHATHTGWNDAALYGEFYRGLAECIKDQLLSLDDLQMFQQLKIDTLKCDTRYWERQGEKTASSGRNRQCASSSAPAKSGNNSTASSDTPAASRANPGIGADGKLTQEERERRRLKGLCYYCGLTINLPAPDCRNSRHPKPPVAGHATFTVMGEPEATIEEEVEGPLTESEN